MFLKIKKLISLELLVLLFGIFAVVFSTYHFYYANKIIYGTYIRDINLSGKSIDEAISIVSQLSKENKVLELKTDDKKFEHVINSDDLNLKYSIIETVNRAYMVGRSGNFFENLSVKAASFINPTKVAAVYSYDEQKLGEEFSKIRNSLNIEGNDAYFSINVETSDLQITPEKTGIKVDDVLMFEVVKDSFENFDFSAKTLQLKELKPKILAKDLKIFNELVLALVEKPLTVKQNSATWDLTPTQKLSLLTFSKKSDKSVEYEFNDAYFSTFVQNLGYQINEYPRGKIISEKDGKVLKIEITQQGRQLDIEKFKSDLKAAFFGGDPIVELSLIESPLLSDTSEYGIKELLGVGKSSFAGSITGRIKNLTLAAERTSGILIPPGGIYSFNDSVGEISGATGYDSAYIISNGRTVLGEGGGVCQTSTTVFRAALNSGLPIVTRHPHAYRVSYYEQDSAPGLDASIYQPSLDFKFKNDTANYILITSVWDLNAQTLEFRIYGTSDGREVEITDPIITNISAPPAPLYVDDPALAKGVVKQIDFPAWGASSYFKRTVKKNGLTLFEEDYTSHYRPWQAVYKVGTRE